MLDAVLDTGFYKETVCVGSLTVGTHTPDRQIHEVVVSGIDRSPGRKPRPGPGLET